MNNLLYKLIALLKKGSYHKNNQVSLNIYTTIYNTKLNVKTKNVYLFLSILVNEGYIYNYNYKYILKNLKALNYKSLLVHKLNNKKFYLEKYFVNHILDKLNYISAIKYDDFFLKRQNYHTILTHIFMLKNKLLTSNIRYKKRTKKIYLYYKHLVLIHYLDQFQYRKKKLEWQYIHSKKSKEKILSFRKKENKINKDIFPRVFLLKNNNTMLQKYQLTIYFKQIISRTPLLSTLKLISKPGHKIYIKAHNLKKIIQHQVTYFHQNDLFNAKKAYGLIILNTSSGLLTHTQAQLQHKGGELLCLLK